MKFYPYILCVIIGLFALNGNAMDTTEQDEEDYSEFDVKKFAKGEFPWSSLITTPCGRKFLLLARTAEKYAAFCARGLQSKKRYIASSLVYGNRDAAGMFMNKTDQMRIGEYSPIYILAEAIADIERVVEEHCHIILLKHKRLYEETRKDDLRLLAEILKNDNLDEVQSIQLDELPDRLEHTHKMWPPEDKDVPLSLSGYAVIRKALEVRKAKAADTLYDDETGEEWMHEILLPKNSVDGAEKREDINN